jgi:Na+(H+)/acetate symporter ActP
VNPTYGVVAVALVSVVTLAIGAYGWRFSRTTSDFFVASRSVRPTLNASAIGGEYLSAASFLGVAGLVLTFGADMLWYPVGWTAGFVFMLVLVAAPLRRSGAYTVPDFAESRLESLLVRRACSALVVVVGWLYLLPQFQGAGLSLGTVADAEPWVGGVLVSTVVLVNVLFGGMRSITFVQAFQYWLKLTALLAPALFLVAVWLGDGGTSPASVTEAGMSAADWSRPIADGDHGLYTTYSIIVATFLGTMGLPHVVVRFYTNPDGRAARRTTLVVLALLGLFYVLPPVYGALGRLYAPDLIVAGAADTVVLELPGRMVDGVAGTFLSSLTAAGAFAAFLSTSSGLTIAVAGVLSQDVFGRGVLAGRLDGVRSFQLGAVVAVSVPLLLALTTEQVGVARAVGLAFAFAASTFCPLIVLGIWWRRLTDVGAVAGMAVGGLLAGGAVVDTLLDHTRQGWVGALLAQPAAWTVPAAFLTMVVVSALTPSRLPAHVATTMVRLHTPESVLLDRGPVGRRPV